MRASDTREVRHVKSRYDIILIMLVVLLSVFGLVMIYSTSSYNAEHYYQDALLYFNNQFKYLLVGFVVMIGVSLIDYRWYIKPFGKRKRLRLIWFLYLFCLGMQIYVLVNGYEAGGSSRWIKIPGLPNLQPSEITKICFVLFTSFLVQKLGNTMNRFRGFFVVSLYMSPLLVLVAKQNLSTAVIMVGIMTCICFIASKKKGYYFWVALIVVAFIAVFILFVGYRGERVTNWLHPENAGSGSQIMQGLYAIASGGLWGKGLGQSIQKLGYIPEVHTDMIFTVICEELGIFGAILVIAVIMMLLWRLMSIAYNAPDMYGGLVASGIMAHIAIQVLLNIAVVTNSIPATGIPFPFISYGGSSLLVLMIEMGIALSVSKYSEGEPIDDAET